MRIYKEAFIKKMLDNLWGDLNEYGDLFWPKDSEEYRKIADVCNMILTDILLIEENKKK